MKRTALTLALFAATACAANDPIAGDGDGDGDADVDPDDPTDPDDPADPTPSFDPPADCEAAPSVDQTVWDHSILSAGISALGSEYHGSGDAIASPGAAASLSARFVYGLVLKDLEDETVLAYAEKGDCQWQSLGEVITDDDGIATVDIPAGFFTEPGAYNVEMVVRGDNSRVRGTVWVVPAGVDAVVFDIDGTLTTSNLELVDEVLTGTEPEMYASADQVVAAYREAGYLPIYVTGRPVYIDVMTRDWLASRGFAAGPLFLTDGFTQGVLEVEAYKRAALLDMANQHGLDVQYAYGNATTDICAYATAGIDPADTYIIGDHRGEACDGFDATNPVTDYPSHLAELAPPAADHN